MNFYRFETYVEERLRKYFKSQTAYNAFIDSLPPDTPVELGRENPSIDALSFTVVADAIARSMNIYIEYDGEKLKKMNDTATACFTENRVTMADGIIMYHPREYCSFRILRNIFIHELAHSTGYNRRLNRSYLYSEKFMDRCKEETVCDIATYGVTEELYGYEPLDGREDMPMRVAYQLHLMREKDPNQDFSAVLFECYLEAEKVVSYLLDRASALRRLNQEMI